MLNNQDLYELFQLKPGPEKPTVCVYAGDDTARLRYTCRFVFNHVLGLNFRITTVPEGIIHVSYHQNPVGGLHILPEGLLTESGVRKNKPESFVKAGNLYFFESIQGYHFDF